MYRGPPLPRRDQVTLFCCRFRKRGTRILECHLAADSRVVQSRITRSVSSGDHPSPAARREQGFSISHKAHVDLRSVFLQRVSCTAAHLLAHFISHSRTASRFVSSLALMP